MNPSTFNQKLKLIKIIEVEDEQGFLKTIKEDVLTFKAYVNGLAGREYWSAKVLKEETSLKVITYYCNAFKDINTKDYFIEFNGEIFDIINIDNVMFNNREIQFKIINRR